MATEKAIDHSLNDQNEALNMLRQKLKEANDIIDRLAPNPLLPKIGVNFLTAQVGANAKGSS
jgi:hypothetical protein